MSSAPTTEIPCRLPPDADRPEVPEIYVGIGGGGRRRNVLPLWKLDLVPNGEGAGGIRREDPYFPRADNDRGVVDLAVAVDGAIADRDRAGVALRVLGDWAWAIAVEAEANARSAVIARSLRMFMGMHHPSEGPIRDPGSVLPRRDRPRPEPASVRIVPSSVRRRRSSTPLDRMACVAGGSVAEKQHGEALDRVPPGRMLVCRPVRHHDSGSIPSHRIAAEVAAGQTATCRLGGTGRPVVGRITLPEGVAMNHFLGGFNRLHTEPLPMPIPPESPRLTDDEWTAWRDALSRTPQ